MNTVITVQDAVELNPSWFYAKYGKDQKHLVLGCDEKRMVIFWYRWDAKKDQWIYELDRWLPNRISVVEGKLIFHKRIEELGI